MKVGSIFIYRSPFGFRKQRFFASTSLSNSEYSITHSSLLWWKWFRILNLDTLPDLNYTFSSCPEPVFCMEIVEYEHLHFVWGKGQSLVTFPAILGLLSRYSTVCADPSNNERVDKDTVIQKSMTVPWISQTQINNLTQLGKPKVDRQNNIIYVRKISAKEALRNGGVTKTSDNDEDFTRFVIESESVNASQ
jgi:hypothetical protein